MKSITPLRLKDSTYRGTATTMREFLTESILNPSVYVADGVRDHMMPGAGVYGTKLSALALDKMEDYLEEVDECKEPPPPK
jgi:hypothetical protein